MAVFFFDTSALVKRYVTETGSGWVRQLTLPEEDHDIYVAKICGAEAIAAFVRHTPALNNLAEILADFKFDFRKQYQRLALTNAVVATAMRVAELHHLRGYDAVQLASAIELQSARIRAKLPALTFISADQILNAAAAAESLVVDDPNNHP